jgi:Tol biopolymer transport system component/tRNA A-37 threonylcarbamoyl transferase component Bud32
VTIQPGTKIGVYEITAAIGAGGMGEVYQAHDTKLGRDVAIKVLPEQFARDPERLARFQREAKLLAALNHPNIATVHGLEQSGDALCLVMELVPGETLRDRIFREGALPVEDALKIARQIAEALEAAHNNEKAIIHRDLKPANVKVTPEGRVKVLDFGLAKAFSTETSSEDVANSPTLSMNATVQGVILGTAAYMSPEQAKGKPLNKATDIFAFGAVLYEMLTGKQAFLGDDVGDILATVVKNDPDWTKLPTDTPPSIMTLLRRCLRKDRQQRLQDASGIRIEIEDVLSGATKGEARTPTQTATGPIGRSAFLDRALASVVAALLVALGAVSFVHFRETPPQIRATRFSLLPPEKTAFNTAPQVAAVSPDGTKLLFQAAALGSGIMQLWVRPLDSLTANAIPGTAGGGNYQPFWSWDSRSIVFYQDDKLKKVSVDGGPLQTLCDALTGAGGTGSWNKDGVILFNHTVNGATTVYRVPAAGGASQAVTTLDRVQGEIAHFWPYFLPDGNHFIYLAVNKDSLKSVIRVGSLDSKESKPLVNAMSFARYAPPGYLLFQSDGTLMAQPFDAGKLQVTGDAFRIVDQVQINATNGRVAFDVSQNGMLFYRATNGLDTRLAWFDRNGKETGQIGEAGGYSSPKLSPDGKRLAVYRSTGSVKAAGDIWVIDLTRNTQTRLTFDPADDYGPLWSPDGSRIAFASTRNGTTGIYIKSSSGTGDDRLLAEIKGSPLPEDWSLDGKSLVYLSPVSGARDLWYLPLAEPAADSAQAPKPVPFLTTSSAERHGQISPDGRWIAYISDETGAYEVYVRSFPNGSGKWQISTTGGYQPRWRRDGGELFYMDPSGKLTAVPIKAGATFEPGAPQPLFQTRVYGMALTTSYSHQYDVTPDGQRFLNNLDLTNVTTAPLTVVTNWTATIAK